MIFKVTTAELSKLMELPHPTPEQNAHDLHVLNTQFSPEGRARLILEALRRQAGQVSLLQTIEELEENLASLRLHADELEATV